MPTIYLLRERSGITHLEQSIGKENGLIEGAAAADRLIGWGGF